MKVFIYYAIFIAVLLDVGVGIVKGIRGMSKNPWGGGNGCNFVPQKVAARYDACCAIHDRDYKEGGWFGSRFDADADLTTCVFKHDTLGKFVWSPLFFIGARYGGPFAFQYGKQKKIEDIPESSVVSQADVSKPK